MKKIVLITMLAAIFFQCEEDSLHTLNVNPKESLNVDPQLLFTYGQFGIAKQIVDADYNNNVDRYWANFLTGTTYVGEANYNAINRDIGGSIFDNIYTESLVELKKAKELLMMSNDFPNIKNNKLACITIMEVFAYQYLVDTFGYIPFTEALDSDNVQPKYDSDEFVYASLTASLEEALELIDINAESFDPNADILYNANMNAWKKFGYSLLLRIGMRQAEINPNEADRLVDLALTEGVFTSNTDNAIYKFIDTRPYVNPVYEYFVVQNRNTDFIATDFFIDMLESRNDPRISIYFDQNIGPNTYTGGTYGANGQSYSDYTHVNPNLTDNPLTPGVLMDYSSVSFLIAEAVERGFTTVNTASYFYEQGIRASFGFLGLSTVDADNYIAQPSVAYATAPGTFQEKIGVQKYLAFFNQPNEAWTEARRLDYPVLLSGSVSGVPNPRRMIYPVNEKLINPNYAEAATAMNNDNLNGAIFWDVD